MRATRQLLQQPPSQGTPHCRRANCKMHERPAQWSNGMAVALGATSREKGAATTSRRGVADGARPSKAAGDTGQNGEKGVSANCATGAQGMANYAGHRAWAGGGTGAAMVVGRPSGRWSLFGLSGRVTIHRPRDNETPWFGRIRAILTLKCATSRRLVCPPPSPCQGRTCGEEKAV